jgi:hypothetical protein
VNEHKGSSSSNKRRENCNAPVRSRFSFFDEMLPGDPEACREDATAADCGERAASAAFFFL